eukprot:COSAG01_NODE_2106_length_8416_cov_47.839485_19_plen_139_part_00
MELPSSYPAPRTWVSRAFPSWNRSILTEIDTYVMPVLITKLRLETPRGRGCGWAGWRARCGRHGCCRLRGGGDDWRWRAGGAGPQAAAGGAAIGGGGRPLEARGRRGAARGGGGEEEVYGEGNLSNLAAIEALEALAE